MTHIAKQIDECFAAAAAPDGFLFLDFGAPGCGTHGADDVVAGVPYGTKVTFRAESAAEALQAAREHGMHAVRTQGHGLAVGAVAAAGWRVEMSAIDRSSLGSGRICAEV
jgi:hypothetical protein